MGPDSPHLHSGPSLTIWLYFPLAYNSWGQGPSLCHFSRLRTYHGAQHIADPSECLLSECIKDVPWSAEQGNREFVWVEDTESAPHKAQSKS